MDTIPKQKPNNCQFSSGPCKKYPTFNSSRYDNILNGRSTRNHQLKQFIKDIPKIEKKVAKLNIKASGPQDLVKIIETIMK